MYIKIRSYAGIVGFYLRKYLPNTCSNLYLFFQRKFSDKTNKKYMNTKFKKIVPLFVNIETINRCNGSCGFCCCNHILDERKAIKMENIIFKKIIDELSDIDYSGVISLNINNEPFLDKELINKLEYIRKKIPKAYSYLFTNGSLITSYGFKEIVDKKLLDELVINNYNKSFKLNKNINEIYQEFKNYKIDFKVIINMRYIDEVLSNRANSSPNKKGSRIIKSLCSIPYTDINIFPNGNVGLCCCDTKEITNFGNVKYNKIIDIFNNYKFKKIRKKMIKGRQYNDFCKYCDFNDIGTRRTKIKNSMKNFEV